MNNEIVFTKEELKELENDLENFSNLQRLSSLLLWIGIAMILLHIVADIFFHITS